MGAIKLTGFLLLLLLVSSVKAENLPLEDFKLAGELYENKQYAEALNLYNQIIDRGFESSPLYYNTANCHIKEGQFGYAILYYLKADKLSPNDDIQTNLVFARQFMPTRLEGVKINPVTDVMDILVKPFTLESMAWIASIFFILTVLIISGAIYFHYNRLSFKIILYFLVIVLLFVSVLTTYKYRVEILTTTGVVVADETYVYSSPSDNGDIEFVGAFGLMVDIEKSKDDFYLVTFENKRKGWVKKEAIGII